DLGIVARTDQPLGTEQQFLATSAQGYVGFLGEWNHDVGEAVKKRVLIVVRDTIPPLKVSVCGYQRALPLDVQSKIGRRVEIGTKPESGQKVSIGLLGFRSAPLELIKVLQTQSGLPSEAQPHALILR